MPSILDLLPASIRYNNPGAQYPGPSASAYGSDNTGVIGGGHLIAGFPDPTSGAAAQFDLMRRRYTGKPLAEAIREWSDNPSSEYTNQVAKDTGLNPNSILTMDTLANPDTGIPLAKSMARFEAGREFPLSDEGWQNAHTASVATREPAGMPVQARALTAGDPNPDGAAIPQNARLASGSVPPGIPTPGAPQQDQGFLSGLGNFLGNNSSELLAIGGGFLNGNPGRGFEQAGRLRVAEGKGLSTSDIKEYQYAKSQGFTGSFEQWQQKKASYGGSKGGLTPIFDQQGNPWQLTQDGQLRPLTAPGFEGGANKGYEKINLGDRVIYRDKLTGKVLNEDEVKNLEAASAKGEGAAEGKGLGDNYQEIVKGANGAVSMKGTLSRLKVLSDNAYDTKAGPAIQAVRSYLGVLGVPLDKVPNGEEFTALSNKLVLDGLGGSLGTGISNADRSFIEQTVPTLGQTKEGRAQIIDYLSKVADRKIEIARMATDYKANNKGSLKGFTDVLAQWSDANPMFPGGGPTGLPPAAPAAAPPPAVSGGQFTPDQARQEIERRRKLNVRQM